MRRKNTDFDNHFGAKNCTLPTYSYCKIAENAWVINSNDSAINIRDHLMRYIDSNDVLFVGTLQGQAAWYGESSSISDWLQKYV